MARNVGGMGRLGGHRRTGERACDLDRVERVSARALVCSYEHRSRDRALELPGDHVMEHSQGKWAELDPCGEAV
jgi:hypothetical protein